MARTEVSFQQEMGAVTALQRRHTHAGHHNLQGCVHRRAGVSRNDLGAPKTATWCAEQVNIPKSQDQQKVTGRDSTQKDSAGGQLQLPLANVK
ncbi:hypothetical protein ABBQ38_013692 [Trebouxia sp. C0009 RCD-2024]